MISEVLASPTRPTEKPQKLFRRKIRAFTTNTKEKFRSCDNVVVQEVCNTIFIRRVNERPYWIVFCARGRCWIRPSGPTNIRTMDRLQRWWCGQNKVRVLYITILIFSFFLLFQWVEHRNICSSSCAESEVNDRRHNTMIWDQYRWKSRN